MDPPSTASGVAALATFSLQTASAVLKLVKNSKDAPRVVREIQDELEELTQNLETLKGAAEAAGPDNRSNLEVPLRCCGKACQDFATLLRKLPGDSSEARSLKEWRDLRYLGTDIKGFRDSIAGYRGTISVALGTINLPSPTRSFNHRAFEAYGRLVDETTCTLSARLVQIKEKLQSLKTRNQGIVDNSAIEKRMREEKDGLQTCLSICDTVASNIDEVKRSMSPREPDTSEIDQKPVLAKWLNAAEGTSNQKIQLELRMQELNDRLDRAFSSQSRKSNSTDRETEKELRDEIRSIKKSFVIFKNSSDASEEQPKINVFEDITTADDSQQMLLSATGDLIFAKRIKTGARCQQMFGQMSNETIQHIVSKHQDSARNSSSEGRDSSKEDFRGRYGAGRALQIRGLTGQFAQ